MSKTPISEQLKWAHLYLLSLHDEAEIKSRKEQARDKLKPWILENLDIDEDGHYFYELPEPIRIDGDWYTGVKAQRRVSEFVDEEKAMSLIDKYDLYKTCTKMVVTIEIDYDELYAANQRGIISDEEIDSILEQDISYALVRVKK